MARCHYHEAMGVDAAVPDWDALGRACPIAVAAWLDDLYLVGYVFATLAPSPMDERTVCGSLAIYVAPEHRSFALTRRMMTVTSEMARARGADVVAWTAQAGSRFHGLLDLMRKRGAVRLAEVIYTEALS